MIRHDSDLSQTVSELSSVYEELSLLYRLSEVLSSLSTDEICARVTDEVVSTIGVGTAAILFLDEQGDKLFTKTFRGSWDRMREVEKDSGPIWRAIEVRKSFAVCNLAETEYRDSFPDHRSLMVCPLVGKVKVLGVIIVADKEGYEEFYSSDSKLLMAIAAQAGFAIENALLHKEIESLLIGAIKALVKALEASSCWTAGHTERVTEYSIGIGRVMGLDNEMIERLKISALLHDVGKIATPKDILNKKDCLTEDEWVEIKRHPGLGAEILIDLKQFRDIILGIKYHHEHWDGEKGIFGLKGEEIPVMARVLSVADAFDAMTSDRPYRRMKSKEEAVEEIKRCCGTQFDPVVVKAFLIWVGNFTPHYRVFSP